MIFLIFIYCIPAGISIVEKVWNFATHASDCFWGCEKWMCQNWMRQKWLQIQYYINKPGKILLVITVRILIFYGRTFSYFPGKILRACDVSRAHCMVMTPADWLIVIDSDCLLQRLADEGGRKGSYRLDKFLFRCRIILNLSRFSWICQNQPDTFWETPMFVVDARVWLCHCVVLILNLKRSLSAQDDRNRADVILTETFLTSKKNPLQYIWLW